MQESCTRLGITNVKCVAADGVDYEDEPADKVLLDAPCSGLGVLMKKPDVKIKREQSDIRKLVDIQRQLIDRAGTLVKPGGALVYSTCTIEPEENFSIIRWFLQQHPEFEIDKQPRTAPSALLSVDGYIETFPS